MVKSWLKNSTAIWYGYNFFSMLKNFPRLLRKNSQFIEPTLSSPTSQLATAKQFFEFPYLRWCSEIHNRARLHRKQWEFVYVLQVLYSCGCLKSGNRGLAFGCGQEPLPAVMVKYGCDIVATDLEWERAAAQGWVASAQHANSSRDLPYKGIVSGPQFNAHITFKNVDMNSIPDDLAGFDFLWSCCAFEHLGSIEHGLKFVQNAMKCLKPGGIAVHTTEFNISSNEDTIESASLSLFRRQDIERLCYRLTEEGHTVFPIKWATGNTYLDEHIDVPPYAISPHIKIKLKDYTCTSIGLIIRKAS